MNINLESLQVIQSAGNYMLKVLSVSEPLTQFDIDENELQNLNPGDVTVQFRAVATTSDLSGIDPEQIKTIPFMSYTDRGGKGGFASGLVLECQVEEYTNKKGEEKLVISAVVKPAVKKTSTNLASFLKANNVQPNLGDEDDEDDEAEKAEAAAKAAKKAALAGKK